MASLHFLCAGASQGVVKALQQRFEAETGATLQGRFGAVGAMKEALLAGEPCDVMILTAAMVDGLCAEGHLLADSRAALGRVLTGVAVRSGTPHPAVATADGLKAALLAADSVYFPDAVRSTAGIHFANVMRRLGVLDTLEPRLRTYPAGAIAMRELAAATTPNPIGCTQVTEILYTPGVELVGLLPQEFELATDYTLGLCTAAAHPEQARMLADLLAGPASAAIRRQGGFEFDGA